MKNRETRNFDFKASNDEGSFTGYAAKWGVLYPVAGMFRERFMPNSMNFSEDVHFLRSHDFDKVLGRKGKNMTLESDSEGLRVIASLPDTTLGIDTFKDVQSGRMDQMSHYFQVEENGEEWDMKPEDGGLPIRTITAAKIVEVSLVARGMNPETTAEVREMFTNPNISKMDPQAANNGTTGAATGGNQNNEPNPNPDNAQRSQNPAVHGGGSSTVSPMGLSAKERRDIVNFNIGDAFRMAEGKNIEGFMAELHQEGVRNNPNYNGEGFAFPVGLDLEARAALGEMRTDQSVTQDSGNYGGNLVETMLGSIVRLYRPNNAMSAAGATVMDGLVGNVDFPTQGNLLSAGWGTEVAAASETDTTIGLVNLRPERLSAVAITTRQLLRQSAIDIQSMLLNDLAAAAGEAEDIAAINGSGSSNVPEGILNTTGVIEHTWDATANKGYDNLVDMEQELADVENLRNSPVYLGSTKFLAHFKKERIDPGSGSFVVDGRIQPLATSNGYPFVSSNNSPNNLGTGTDESALIFGDFRDGIVIGRWNAPTLLIDPYTLATTSKIRMILDRHVGILVRKPTCFVKTTAAL